LVLAGYFSMVIEQTSAQTDEGAGKPGDDGAKD
jgi:hypothetical protein